MGGETEEKSAGRKLYIVGEINEENFGTFSEQLSELEEEDHSPVEVELFSGGGFATAALAFRGRIRTSPCKINIKAYGDVASAAVLVLAAGNYRAMAREVFVLLHEDSGRPKGRVKELETFVNQLRRYEEQWAELLEEETGTSRHVWAALHSEEVYLTPNQCLEYGLVDEII